MVPRPQESASSNFPKKRDVQLEVFCTSSVEQLSPSHGVSSLPTITLQAAARQTAGILKILAHLKEDLPRTQDREIWMGAALSRSGKSFLETQRARRRVSHLPAVTHTPSSNRSETRARLGSGHVCCDTPPVHSGCCWARKNTSGADVATNKQQPHGSSLVN